MNPTGFLAAVQSAVPGSPQYGNPQRRWIDGAITEYFKAGRDADVLWQAFDQRVQRGNMTPSREANAAGAVRLLDRFLEWDSKEVDVPADTFPPVRDVAIGPHVIAVRRDLIYIDPAGSVKANVTNHQLRPQHPVAVQMAAAVLVSVDADLGTADGLRRSVGIATRCAPALAPETTRGCADSALVSTERGRESA